MSSIQAVTAEVFGDRYWKGPSSYSFTQTQALCPMVAQELSEACLSLPLAFAETEGVMSPVAILGLEAKENLVIDASGHWRAPYVPRNYRCYPFSLAISESERLLCVDDSFCCDSLEEGAQEFYTLEREPTETILRILNFLSANLDHTSQTIEICKVLESLGLFEEWPLEVVINNEQRPINGLYRISEIRLNSLKEEDLAKARDCDGLVLAYAQLFSMSHVRSLVRLAHDRSSVTTSESVKEIDFDNLEGGGTISFDNL